MVHGAGLPRDAARVARLTLTRFRSYAALTMQPESSLIALVGPNGAGKTNVLEALSLLVPGRGLRGATMAEMGQDGAADWGVHVVVEAGGAVTALGTGPEPAKPERRTVRLDGVTARGLNALGDVLGVVWLTPAQDGLFRDGPGERRRFVDRLVAAFDPAHAGHLAAYANAMRQRNKVLAEGGGAHTHSWLDGLEATMAAKGVAVAAARRDLLERLNAGLAQAHPGGFPGALLSLHGGPEADLDRGAALDVEDALAVRWAADRSRDAATGITAVGPHRTDLDAVLLPKGLPAAQCSTGEQKALLLAILLAHGTAQAEATGRLPLMLLDEVTAHLDPDRRAALLAALVGMGVQAWMTGTEPALFADLPKGSAQYRVGDGTVVPLATP